MAKRAGLVEFRDGNGGRLMKYENEGLQKWSGSHNQLIL